MPVQVRRKRQRSIRVLLTAIFIVPVVSLLGLWAFAASVTVSNAVQEHNFNNEDQKYGGWAQQMFTALATERLQAYQWLSTGGQSSKSDLLVAQQHTDGVITSFRKGINSAPLSVPSARPALITFYSKLALLTQLRSAVNAQEISPLTAFERYNGIVDSEFDLYADLVRVNNTTLYVQAAASVEAGRAVELGSREVTLIYGAILSGGQMPKAARVVFAQLVAERRFLMNDALMQLQPSLGSGYQEADNSAAYKSFMGIENTVVSSVDAKGPIPVNALQFGAAVTPLFQNEYHAAQVQDRLAVSSLGTSIGNRLLLEVGLAGGIGLLAIVLSVFFMVRFGRRISRDLTGLQTAALELAEERLPSVVARLSKGEVVDVAAEAAALAPGRIKETAAVADAFSSVQRTAVEAAVGQARLRAGVAQVFRNLAWRSQSLLHRQLTLLDGMERRSTEPETLDELFQLDHLTTRMRRHAEGLIILSGATPGRGWREPVPIMDVLRGAIAEVEDYKRVTVICESQDAVVGSAVADVIHLLAELVENATTYSPASTEVMIRAERVANGFVIEVEDRGIGMTADDMAGFNERLANPPEFDIADSNQLGLFVVGRLAAKHSIKVTLRSSPYGGTSAIALLPHPIVVINESPPALSAGLQYAGLGRDRSRNGRHMLPGSGRDTPELTGSGRESAAGQTPLPSTHAESVGTSRSLDAATSVDAGSVTEELTGIRSDVTPDGDLAGGGLRVPSSRQPVENGLPPRHALESQQSGSEMELVDARRPRPGDQGVDVFRPIRPGSAQPQGASPGPEVAATGRLTSQAMPDAKPAAASPWSASPAWKPPTPAPDVGKPGLPRRVRQASLAPQLKSDPSPLADGGYATAAEVDCADWPAEGLVTGGEDAHGSGIDNGNAGPDPADTRDLVQSLQTGLERARTSATSGEDPWPAPAGSPDLAGWPEDPEGQ